MGLLSFFHRSADSASAPSQSGGPADAVQQARTRARQRLIGAAVLVVIGVVGFPLVFETQPRPIPVDVPIELPRRDATATPSVTAAPNTRTGKAATKPAPVAEDTAVAAPRDEVITETRAEAGREVAAPAVAASTATNAAERGAAKPTPAKPVAEAPKKPETAAKPAESTRAKALLDDKPAAAAPDATRFVVQVGAFAEADAARETRLKVEKLGLKTYTQVATTAAGNRIRVRVGPFASREEADKALAKARAAGVAAVVLTL
jgi:DedD protein